MTIKKHLETITEETDIYTFAKEKPPVCLKRGGRIITYSSKRNGKQNQHQFNRGPNITPICEQMTFFKSISKMSADNKLKQSSFKLRHKILVIKIVLKRYKIKLVMNVFSAKVHISSNTRFWPCRRGLNRAKSKKRMQIIGTSRESDDISIILREIGGK